MTIIVVMGLKNNMNNTIGIFYLTRQWAENTFRKILEIIPRDSIRYFIDNKYKMSIVLKDGSCIEFFQVNNKIRDNDKIRGKRCNKIYYQDGISHEVIKTEISPLWRPLEQTLLEDYFDTERVWDERMIAIGCCVHSFP